MSSINVIGPGSIGLCIGAALIDNNHDVNFIGRQKISELTIYRKNTVFRNHAINNISDIDSITESDWLLISVKSHQISAAKDVILSAIRANTKIAVIQNGVSHIDNMNDIGVFDNLLAVMVDLPANRINASEVIWHEKAIMYVNDSDLGKEFCELFSNSFVNVNTTTDIKTKLWRKLCVNAPSGALLCLTGKHMAVYHEEGIADIGRGILQEVINVGRKEGAILSNDIIEEQMTAFLNAKPEETNSMFDDFKAGIPTEWKARNAVIVKLGKKHGVPTPISNLLVPLLAAQKRL
jgi:2-dehydropantoate 2-reductase